MSGSSVYRYCPTSWSRAAALNGAVAVEVFCEKPAVATSSQAIVKEQSVPFHPATPFATCNQTLRAFSCSEIFKRTFRFTFRSPRTQGQHACSFLFVAQKSQARQEIFPERAWLRNENDLWLVPAARAWHFRNHIPVYIFINLVSIPPRIL